MKNQRNQFVLIMGHRRGISKALESLDIPFIVWTQKKIKNPIFADSIIELPFPNSVTDIKNHLKTNRKISHVIAGTEDAVIPASKTRMWLNARRNPHTLLVRCTDKFEMKKYLFEKNIPMTPFINAKTNLTGQQIVAALGSPIICKPRQSSGSRGLIQLSSTYEIEKQIGKNMIFEKIIHGTEGSIESLIVNGKIVFSNITQYMEVGLCNLVPGHFPEALQNEIHQLNENVISALKIKWGMTHIEYYVTPEGVLFGEIAARPPGGYIMEALSHAYQVNFWEQFVRVELDLFSNKIPDLKNYTSSVVIYPKLGTIMKVEGIDEIKKLKSFISGRIKLKPMQAITERLGLGQDYGHLIFSNKGKEQLIDDLKAYKSLFQVTY